MYNGVALAIGSYFAFAILFYFTSLLHPLSGDVVFSWRMLLTLPFLTAFIFFAKEWWRVKEILSELKRSPFLLMGLILSSFLLGFQQWLFMWAPLNGRGLQVSLGYFLLPLSMLFFGKVVYGERASVLQKWAGLFASVGVANQIFQTGGFSWETLLVALGYPAYFILRRKLGTAHLGGLWFDMLFMTPFAAWIISAQYAERHYLMPNSNLYVMVIFLGLISSVAVMLYISASQLLTMSIFGLLGYVEPILMMLVALVLNEHIKSEEWFTYITIWMAVLMLVVDGISNHVKSTNIYK